MRILPALLLLTSLATATPRDWRDRETGRSLRGEFVSRDATAVTILRGSDLQRVKIPLAKLHPDDLRWLDANHPLPGAKSSPSPPPAAPPKNAVFDTLVFGDTRKQVLGKLKASQFVELTADETYLGRTGLNGVFRTRKDIGGLPCKLSFDWKDDGGLTEVTLQTSGLPDSDYTTRIKTSWTELAKLLTQLHGLPIQTAGYPLIGQLGEGSFLATHLWKLEGGGTVMLGPARDSDGIAAVVRFTQREIAPAVVPNR